MSKGLFALLLAGALVVPPVDPAAAETVGVATRTHPQPAKPWTAQPLSAVPYLDTMPAMSAGPADKSAKLDRLWGPELSAPDLLTARSGNPWVASSLSTRHTE